MNDEYDDNNEEIDDKKVSFYKIASQFTNSLLWLEGYITSNSQSKETQIANLFR